MSVLVAVGVVVVVAGLVVGAAVLFRVFERGLAKGLRRMNDSLTERPQKPRRKQVAGRNHVREFPPGAIFCPRCGKIDE